MDFEAEAEPWTTLALSDGTTLKVRPSIGKIIRLEDYDQHGDPIYQVFSGPLALRITGVPEKLKGKPMAPGMKAAPASVEVG